MQIFSYGKTAGHTIMLLTKAGGCYLAELLITQDQHTDWEVAPAWSCYGCTKMVAEVQITQHVHILVTKYIYLTHNYLRGSYLNIVHFLKTVPSLLLPTTLAPHPCSLFLPGGFSVSW